MESANYIHHPLHEHQHVGSSSASSLATTSSYGSVAIIPHAWNTPNSILNTNSMISSYPNETLMNQRQEENTSLLSSLSYTTSMPPDSSFHQLYNPTANFITSQSAEDLQISRIKDELAENYYLKYTELVSNSPSSSSTDQESSQLRNDQRINYLQLPNDHLSTKFLLKSHSSGNLASKSHNEGDFLYSSQVFPSVPVSSLNQIGVLTSQGPSLDMNLEALDLLTSSSSSRFNGNFMSPFLENQIGMIRDGFNSNGFGHHMQQQSHQFLMYKSINDKMTRSGNGVAEAKRTSSKLEPSKQIHQTATKKPRSEARSSCPPFKVRKEKLGDRIAALQQLVAPFGKTDTASVLMEAIGYIKFLQNQVETLSVPYMKPAARNKSNRLTKGGSMENEEEEPRRDLKSRGLCLVPLSCLSYITDGGGGAAVWPPPHHFGGPTGEQY